MKRKRIRYSRVFKLAMTLLASDAFLSVRLGGQLYSCHAIAAACTELNVCSHEATTYYFNLVGPILGVDTRNIDESDSIIFNADSSWFNKGDTQNLRFTLLALAAVVCENATIKTLDNEPTP